MANFMSDSDANTVLGGFAEAIKTKEPLVFKGTQAEWDALTEEEQSNFELVCLADDSETGETVDAVTDGDMRAVTSNAVAKAIEPKLFTGSATKSAYVASGNITWQWTGRICRVLFEAVKIAANTPFLSNLCTGLPPANGTEFLTVCAEHPTTTVVGFLRTDRNNGVLQADASVGGLNFEVTLYASVSYITSEDAHQI